MSHDSHSNSAHYIKIWAILLVLLIISVIGPHIGASLNLKIITLITAFGIAIIKALLVAKHFMHINLEKRVIPYIILAMLICDGIFFSGTAADIMKHSGTNWHKVYDEKAVKPGSHQPVAE